jgi:hypothetical protein
MDVANLLYMCIIFYADYIEIVIQITPMVDGMTFWIFVQLITLASVQSKIHININIAAFFYLYCLYIKNRVKGVFLTKDHDSSGELRKTAITEKRYSAINVCTNITS